MSKAKEEREEGEARGRIAKNFACSQIGGMEEGGEREVSLIFLRRKQLDGSNFAPDNTELFKSLLRAVTAFFRV